MQNTQSGVKKHTMHTEEKDDEDGNAFRGCNYNSTNSIFNLEFIIRLKINLKNMIVQLKLSRNS